VQLEVQQTIDELVSTVQQGNAVLPVIGSREANTQVMVQSGQTIVIGGIIRDRESKQRTGIPLLQDLPLIGPLFRSTKDVSERAELMVFLTPFVITSDAQLQRIKEQRIKDLSDRFPEVLNYLDNQQSFGEELPAPPAEPTPPPTPQPPTEPVPQAAGPERSRTGSGRPSLGPPAPER
jgi:general secretion pathway protein D